MGTTEYLRNGGVNSVGEMSLLGKDKGEDLEIKYSFQSTGEWMVEEDKLIEKMVDIKSFPKSIKQDAVELDLQKLEDPEILKGFPKIEDEMPKGESTESTILSINESTMKVSTKEAPCEGTIEREKRGKTFSALPQVQISWVK